MRWARRIVWVAVFVALLVGGWRFAHDNGQPVDISYLAGHFEQVAVWKALLAAFGAGVVVTAVLGVLRGARLRLEARRYRKAARELEAEVHQLRNLPLAREEAEPGERPAVPAPLGGLERGT